MNTASHLWTPHFFLQCSDALTLTMLMSPPAWKVESKSPGPPPAFTSPTWPSCAYLVPNLDRSRGWSSKDPISTVRDVKDNHGRACNNTKLFLELIFKAVSLLLNELSTPLVRWNRPRGAPAPASKPTRNPIARLCSDSHALHFYIVTCEPSFSLSQACEYDVFLDSFSSSPHRC